MANKSTVVLSKSSVLVLMCGVVAMTVLDLSVVNVALPSIQAHLHAKAEASEGRHRWPRAPHRRSHRHHIGCAREYWLGLAISADARAAPRRARAARRVRRRRSAHP